MTDSNEQNAPHGGAGPLAPGSELSHYRIIRKIDEGGMGEIYLAEDQKLHREVAIKVLRPEFVGSQDRLERFIREARTAAKISHANVMSIFDIGSIKDTSTGRETAYIVLEHIGGDTLSEVLQTRKLGMAESLRIAEKIASGLSAAHKLGIVHRDIKPDNIKFDENGEPRILDFGLAKSVGPFAASETDVHRNTISRELTREGKILGTVTYMSPEQARGDVIDMRSDIFSFGILLYRMFTGRFPFEAPDRVSTMAKIIESRQPTASEFNDQIPPELDRVIEKCLRKDPDDRYQDTRDLVVDLRSLRKQLDSGITDSDSFIMSGSGRRRKKKFRMSSAGALITLSAMVVISVLAISYIPQWGANSNEAHASENRLAIVYFQNLADPEDPQRLGEIAANILITDLSVSPEVKVVSSQRLRDVLQLMGESATRRIDDELASQVARKANTRWLLTGSILQTEPYYVISAQLVETGTGHVISSHRIEGEPDETIFTVVDRISSKIKDDLSLSESHRSQSTGLFARSEAGATTSKEAFRFYLEGMDYQGQFLHIAARDAFKKALELDSTFALAWYGISQYLPDEEGGKNAIAKAVQYIDKVSPIEQKYILARVAIIDSKQDSAEAIYQGIIEEFPDEKWAYYQLGLIFFNANDMERAIELHLKAIQIDPLFKDVYNQLAYEYDRAGNFDKSIWAINKYIELAPNEPNPYDSRGELYARNGYLLEARESFQKAITANPEFYISAVNLGHVYIEEGEYTKAESLFHALASHSDKDVRSDARLYLARIPERQGQMHRALRALEIAMESDRIEFGADNSHLALRHSSRSNLYIYLGGYSSAITEVDSALAKWDKEGLSDGLDTWAEKWSSAYKSYILALAGRNREADSLMQVVLQAIDTTELDDMTSYYFVQGRLDFAQRRFDKALEQFKTARGTDPSFSLQLWMGKTFLELGQTGEAVAALEGASKVYSSNRSYWTAEGVFIHYWLGRAYEESSWNDRAAEQYRVFLDIFKNADPEVRYIDDANSRLARLTHG